jgi:hypothetical protein
MVKKATEMKKASDFLMDLQEEVTPKQQEQKPGKKKKAEKPSPRKPVEPKERVTIESEYRMTMSIRMYPEFVKLIEKIQFLERKKTKGLALEYVLNKYVNSLSESAWKELQKEVDH